MEVKFLKACGTVDTTYKKGGIYDLEKAIAEQFVKEGLAVATAPPAKTTETTKAPKRRGRPKK